MASKKVSSGTLEDSLRKHGEAFMRMFYDSDEDRGEMNGGGQDIEALVETDPAPRGTTEDPPGRTRKKSKKKKRRMEASLMANPMPSKTEDRVPDDLDAIFGAIERGKEDSGGDDIQGNQETIRPVGKKKWEDKKDSGTLSSERGDTLDAQQREEERLRRKLERKRFMSSNPESLLSFDEAAMRAEAKRRFERSQRGDVVKKSTEMEEFKAIRREIQSFGASGLDRKSRAKFEQDRLLELGARKEKGVRMPAKIGMGIAKKAAWREQRSIDEAIASGMVSRKAIADKKRRAQKKERSAQDRGLWEDGGNFNARRGVLRVRK